MKSKTPLVLFTLIAIIVAIIFFCLTFIKNNREGNIQKLMPLTLFVQDKKIAEISDCGATMAVTYQVPETKEIFDTSLKILFAGELAKYGSYERVTVSDGLAKVFLKDDFSYGLSSCESSHLLSVLEKTLGQYGEVRSVELYSPSGKVEF